MLIYNLFQFGLFLFLPFKGWFWKSGVFGGIHIFDGFLGWLEIFALEDSSEAGLFFWYLWLFFLEEHIQSATSLGNSHISRFNRTDRWQIWQSIAPKRWVLGLLYFLRFGCLFFNLSRCSKNLPHLSLELLLVPVVIFRISDNSFDFPILILIIGHLLKMIIVILIRHTF